MSSSAKIYPALSPTPSSVNHPQSAALTSDTQPATPASQPHPVAPVTQTNVIIIEDDGRPANFSTSFTDAVIRRRFIRNVYGILMLQLLVTLGVICLFIFSKDVRDFVHSNPWFYYASYITFVVTVVILGCFQSIRRAHPWNFILLGILTLSISYVAGTISSYYDTKIVLWAVIICALVCLAVSLCAATCQMDFTDGRMMCGLLLFLMVFTLLGAVLFAFLPPLYSYWYDGLISGLIALLFMAFLAFDTQRILGGKSAALSPEEHIAGAMQLYLDIVLLFLLLLGISGGANR